MASTTVPTKSQSAIQLSARIVWLVIVAILFIAGLAYFLYRPQQATAVFAQTIRQSTPLVLGAMCGLVGERSGVINIGIEGQMLMSAFLAFLANVYIGNLFIATLVGVGSGMLLGLFLAWMSVTLKMDQIIGGTIINVLAAGLTSFFYVAGLTTSGKLQPIALGPLAKIPLVGPVLFDNAPITYITIIFVFLLQFALFRTVWGLRTRAVGEHPSAADTVGISVPWMRYLNVTLAGGLAGLAGAYLTLEAVGSFERDMTNGRGFVALAVMIFGKWTPLGSWGGALLFGFASALQTQFQFMGLDFIPHQFIGMMPYVVTIIVLAGFVGRSRPPAAVGKPYDTE